MGNNIIKIYIQMLVKLLIEINYQYINNIVN
jgi:hypothetical protein